MSVEIRTKQIAFNIKDPYQKELYDHADKFRNFSYYGKSLIQRDLEDEKAAKRLKARKLLEGKEKSRGASIDNR